jgi:ubiquinone biosynthesis protein
MSSRSRRPRRRRIIEEELGVRISKLFDTFEREPIAAASLGQVHRATLRDGRAVAVKVQRPGIRQQIMDDLDAFAEVATFLDEHTDAGRRYGMSDMLDQFRSSLLRELDYNREAHNLTVFHSNMGVRPASSYRSRTWTTRRPAC